jgi:hypothetical protein
MSLFEIPKEGQHTDSREIVYEKSINPSAGTARDDRQKLPQRVSVTLSRVGGEVSFNDEMFQQKSANPGT